MSENYAKFRLDAREKWFYVSVSILLIFAAIYLFVFASDIEFTMRQLTVILALIFFGSFALKYLSTELIFNNNVLQQKSLFVNQSVNLAQLVKAEKVGIGGDRPFRFTNFYLVDAEGNGLIFHPDDYELRDRKEILERLAPYIFINRVDKNFTLSSFDERLVVEPPLPKASKFALLYVLLPALAIILIILILTIITT